MKLLKGYILKELTEERIVQEKSFGKTGLIRITGTPNPSVLRQRECIDKAAEILLSVYEKEKPEQ